MKTVKAFMAGAMLLAEPVFADTVVQDVQLPSTLSWTPHDVGSSSDVQAAVVFY